MQESPPEKVVKSAIAATTGYFIGQAISEQTIIQICGGMIGDLTLGPGTSILAKGIVGFVGIMADGMDTYDLSDPEQKAAAYRDFYDPALRRFTI